MHKTWADHHGLVAVRFVKHYLQHFVDHAFVQFFVHVHRILERDLACFVFVEGLQFLDLRVPTENLLHLHLRDLFVVIGAVAVVIHEAEGAHMDLEFLGVDHSHRFVDVEENEGLIRKLLVPRKGVVQKRSSLAPPCMRVFCTHLPESAGDE